VADNDSSDHKITLAEQIFGKAATSPKVIRLNGTSPTYTLLPLEVLHSVKGHCRTLLT
jgi:hypothetical protein